MYKSIQKGLLTVRQAAHRLGLHEQTVYRKCARGELHHVRFGRTIRIPECEIDQSVPEAGRLEEEVPAFMHRYFWDHDVDELTLPSPIILGRILEMGDLPEVTWLLERVGRRELGSFVREQGSRWLTERSANFWNKMLGIDDEDDARDPAGQAANTLGKARWR